jgi:lipopolysaccharide export LptBFGC system permease protein LptF
MNESTFSLPEDSEPLNDNSVLTLRDMNNFDTAKTGNMNAPKFNDDNLNLDENVLSLNKNVLNLNKKNNVMNLNNMNNLNKNKNKNTLIGGRRKSKKARQTRRK